MRSAIPVSAVYRIPNQAVDSEMLVKEAIDDLGRFERDRVQWMKKREEYYLGWDDYTSSNLKGLWDGSANYHFPLTEIQTTAMHALVMQAIFFERPWFYVDPQEAVDVARIEKIEAYMKYVLMRYANNHKGIYLAIDDWAHDLTTEGVGILSRGWKIEQRRFYDIERDARFERQAADIVKLLEDTPEEEFDRVTKELVRSPYKEVMKVRTVFNGPTLIAEDPIFVLFKGDVIDATDLDEHKSVIQVCHFDKNDLIRFKDSEYFDEDVVDQILEYGPDIKGSNSTSSLYDRKRRAQDIQDGVNTSPTDSDVYELIKVYKTIALNSKDKYAYEDRLQYFVHPKSMTLPRWTYLDRISANGKIPLHMAHLFRRPRRSMGRGMVQTMSPLNDGIDILLNQSIDAGILASNPMFAYKGDSTFDPGEIRTEPGLGIKTDDPNSDLRFFQWSVNPNWSSGIQGTLVNMAQQLTGIGPSQLGQVGGRVGPLRSTSGVNALDRNASVIHDVPIKRVNLAMSDVFEGMYADCYERMPEKLTVTILGSEGEPLTGKDGRIMKKDISKEELTKRVHFGLYANSKTMNRQAKLEDAAAIAQFSFQKAPIEWGLIGPQEGYEILMNYHRAMGTARPGSMVSKPQNARALPLAMELAMIMQGQMPPIAHNDPEHQTKIDKLSPLVDSDQATLEAQHGMVAPNAMDVLKAVIDEHERYLAMLERPSNVTNPYGSNQSPTMAQGVSAEQNAAQSETGGLSAGPAEMGGGMSE